MLFVTFLIQISASFSLRLACQIDITRNLTARSVSRIHFETEPTVFIPVMEQSNDISATAPIPTIELVHADDDDNAYSPEPTEENTVDVTSSTVSPQSVPRVLIPDSSEYPPYSPGTPPPGFTLSSSPSNGGVLGLHGILRNPSSPPTASLDVPSRYRNERSRSPSPARSYNNSAVGEDSLTISVPPSPTISERSSGHFPTSVALRDNRPEQKNGLTSLVLLNPNSGYGNQASHMRKESAATFTSTLAGTDHGHEGGEMYSPSSPNPDDLTEAGHSPTGNSGSNYLNVDFNLRPRSGSDTDAYSRRTSVTIAAPASPKPSALGSPDSPVSGKKNRGLLGVHKGKTVEDGALTEHSADKDEGDESSKGRGKSIPESQEPEVVDPRPFSSTLAPRILAGLVDPKNMDRLCELGGVEGVINGLGTSRKRGLCGLHAKDRERQATKKGGGEDERLSERGAGEGAGQRHERSEKEEIGERILDASGRITASPPVSPTTIISPTSLAVKEGQGNGGGDPYSATFADRQRVYGANVLPNRQSKSLLLLMWLALKDKVLVSILSLFTH